MLINFAFFFFVSFNFDDTSRILKYPKMIFCMLYFDFKVYILIFKDFFFEYV